MNRFRFDSHIVRQRIPYIMTALISSTVSVFLMLLVLRFTGLGTQLSGSTAYVNKETLRQGTIGRATSDYERKIINAVQQIAPSVVMISTTTLEKRFSFFQGPIVKKIQGVGSGVVIREDGYILTNNHVIKNLSGSVGEITVVLSNGESFAAKVVGSDEQTDLAVLKINCTGLTEPTWADSDELLVGQTAIAIGSPLGETLNNTVTVGIISALNRSVKVSDELQLDQMIQTDASINLGSSGGPLLDSDGQIVGLNTLIVSNSQGIGFAITSNTARKVALELVSKGFVARPGLGIGYAHFSAATVKDFEKVWGDDIPVKQGIMVLKIVPGSEAEKSGLKAGDIITAIDGKLAETDLIQEYVAHLSVGTVLKLTIIRQGQIIQIKTKVCEI